jgi:hypothetical protein
MPENNNRIQSKRFSSFLEQIEKPLTESIEDLTTLNQNWFLK